MYRTHNNGALRIENVNETVTLCGWVQKTRKLGGMSFVDLRDRYGITQLVFNDEKNAVLAAEAEKLGREFVIQIEGAVAERESNSQIPTPLNSFGVSAGYLFNIKLSSDKEK